MISRIVKTDVSTYRSRQREEKQQQRRGRKPDGPSAFQIACWGRMLLAARRGRLRRAQEKKWVNA